MGMNESEKKVLLDFTKEGYSYLRGGHPDFVFFKKNDNKISDVRFVEVKTDKGSLSKNQILYGEVLKSLGINIDVIFTSTFSGYNNEVILPEGIEMICKRCKNRWTYSGFKKPGKYPKYTPCPKCYTSVRIKEEKKENE